MKPEYNGSKVEAKQISLNSGLFDSESQLEEIKASPWFILKEDFNPNKERVIETILSFGNGFMGCRNSLEEYYGLSDPATFVGGLYQKNSDTKVDELVEIPNWTSIEIFVNGNRLDLVNGKTLSHSRYIDLAKGLVCRVWRTQDTVGRITLVKIVKYISLANKHEAYKGLLIKPVNYSGKIMVISNVDGKYVAGTVLPGKELFLTLRTADNVNDVVMSQQSYFNDDSFKHERITGEKNTGERWEWTGEIDKEYIIESLVTVFTTLENENPYVAGSKYLEAIKNKVFKESVDAHFLAWQHCWKRSLIIIEKDNTAQRWVNFALYHLISAGRFSGVYNSIGARGLAGSSYQGHVFWDTEIYLLPFYIFTSPEIARALLMYRFNTLEGARKNAKKENQQGACFAWESTQSGIEMTPTETISPYGEILAIYSGLYEVHITPDITYAIWLYWQVTGDDEFLVNYGSEIIFEATRFCEGLLKEGKDGLYHINDVVGPDEYHERIHDNAYTNIMAQYNIDIALKLIDFLNSHHKRAYDALKEKINLQEKEILKWREVKDKVYTGMDNETKIFEQFAGFFDNEHIDLRKFEPRTMSMDVLLGRERIKRSQIIKQPDVLMFLFLLSNNFSEEIIRKNYDYYEPRCAHGSSLSPSIHSVMAARLGKLPEAYRYFEQNALIDLDDNMENAAGGIHMASAGGTWMIMVMGFAGMYVFDNGLLFDPHLPGHWDKLIFPLCWRKHQINVEMKRNEVFFELKGDDKVNMSVGFENWRLLVPGSYSAYYKEKKWHWKE